MATQEICDACHKPIIGESSHTIKYKEKYINMYQGIYKDPFWYTKLVICSHCFTNIKNIKDKPMSLKEVLKDWAT